MISIVTDSTAYITRAEAEELGVTIVPMTYSVDGVASYSETYMGENGAFEEVVERYEGRLRTSQATFNSFCAAFGELCSCGNEVLCITMSSRMSGTYGNALMAARGMSAGRIRVVDSRSTASGLYLMLRAARRMIDAGGDVDQVAGRLDLMRSSLNTYFSVDDITPLRLSGRLSGVRLSVSTILNIKPMLKIDGGSVVSYGVARGRQEQMRALIRAIGGYRGEQVVEYFSRDTMAREVAAQLVGLGHDVSLRRVGPVLGIHLGEGCVGVSWIDVNEGEDSEK